MGGTLEISELRKRLNSLDEQLKEERVIVVKKHGRKVFAFVDLQYLSGMFQIIEMVSDPAGMKALRHQLDVNCPVDPAMLSSASAQPSPQSPSVA
jgi:hypothetical protein